MKFLLLFTGILIFTIERYVYPFSLQTQFSFLFYQLSSTGTREPVIIFLLEFSVLLFVLFQLPIILGFIFYFVLWHSIFSFKNIVGYLRKDGLILGKKIAQQIGLYSLLSFGGFVLFGFTGLIFLNNNSLIAYVFLALAVLTAPHIMVMHNMCKSIHFIYLKEKTSPLYLKIKKSMVRYIVLLIGVALFGLPEASAQNPKGIITIKNGGTITIRSGSYLITNADIDNRGTLQNAGNIVLNGMATQNFPGPGTITLMNTLEVRNTGAGVLLNKSLRINKELKLTTGNFALNNFDVAIQSDATQTAYISPIGSGAGVSYVTGRFIIERFINVGTAGHTKSWQLLSVPALGKTIKETWQESGTSLAGYGTQITNPLGVGAGYDIYTQNTSLKTYVSSSSSFDLGPSSTNAIIDNPKGYYLFVRGDRTVASGSGTSPTVLRIKGTIHTPAAPPSIITVASNLYESVGNPYVSQIDFSLLTRTGGTDNKFYAWDPWLTGLYGVGAYQTISATNGWVSVPGGGNYSGVHKTIESGQAIFVHTTGSSGTLSFSENAKTNSDLLVNKELIFSNRQFIRSSLFTGTGILVDGNAVAIDANLSNKIDGDDALKILNGGENFAFTRAGQVLSIEGKNTLSEQDTIFFFIKNLRVQQYRILVNPINVNTNNQAYFVDRFLNSTSALSLRDSTSILFNITTDSLSAKSDRFMIVFRQKPTLAGTAVNIQAVPNIDHSVFVSWQNIAESRIKQYVVERSTDGVNFLSVGTLPAVMNNTGYASYTLRDLQTLREKTYYRIQIIDNAGTKSYSDRVTVSPLLKDAGFTVYPNPIINKVVKLSYTGQVPGDYAITLINANGQAVWKGKTILTNEQGNISIDLPKGLAPGVYQLMLYDKRSISKKYSITVL